MVREILSVSIGGCGIGLGQHVWDQFITEHDIDHNGINAEKQRENSQIATFFEERNNLYKPRSVFIDTELEKIDSINSTSLNFISINYNE